MKWVIEFDERGVTSYEKRNFTILFTLISILLLGACSRSDKMVTPKNGMLLVGRNMSLKLSSMTMGTRLAQTN